MRPGDILVNRFVIDENVYSVSVIVTEVPVGILGYVAIVLIVAGEEMEGLAVMNDLCSLSPIEKSLRLIM